MSRSATDKAELFRTAWRLYFAAANLGEIEPHEEYNFDHAINRRHRFDFAFPAVLVAVEVEGNAWNVKGGGRHIQDSDMEKYNIAASMGWRVFRYSPSMLKRDPLGCAKQVYEAVIDAGTN